jgi:predicted amidohydrolase
MLRKLGFFHFCGEDRSDPAGSLRTSLVEAAKEEDISGLLIVTPEAFNIRKGYWNPDRQVEASIRAALMALSAEFKVALVAGLIEESDSHGPGYSSAYLIDGRACHLLARKMGNDGSGNYRCCTEDCDKPIQYDGVSIAVLICMDGISIVAIRGRRWFWSGWRCAGRRRGFSACQLT